MRIFLSAPNANPFIYDLLAAHLADKTIYTNNIHFNRKQRAHRIRIGSEWHALPIEAQVKDRPLNQIQLINKSKFADELYQKLAYNYRNKRYFDYYKGEIVALIEKAIHDCNSLADVCHSIRTHCCKLIEWPKSEIYDWFELTGIENSNRKDPADVLEKNLDTSPIHIIHEWKSQSFQRQSSYNSSISTSYLQRIEKAIQLSKDQTLLDLLFTHGAYWFEHLSINESDFFS